MTSAKDRNIKPGAAHGTESRPSAAKSLETFLALVPQGEHAGRAGALLAEIRRSGATSKR